MVTYSQLAAFFCFFFTPEPIVFTLLRILLFLLLLTISSNSSRSAAPLLPLSSLPVPSSAHLMSSHLIPPFLPQLSRGGSVLVSVWPDRSPPWFLSLLGNLCCDELRRTHRNVLAPPPKLVCWMIYHGWLDDWLIDWLIDDWLIADWLINRWLDDW